MSPARAADILEGCLDSMRTHDGKVIMPEWLHDELAREGYIKDGDLDIERLRRDAEVES